MKIRVPIVVGGTAAALGLIGMIVLPAAAGARAVTHKLKFTSEPQAETQFSKTNGTTADKDVDNTGKVIGFDMLRFTLNQATGKASLGLTVDLSGGFLYGTMSESKSTSSVAHGRVTGGTGKFTGAKGTITATTNQAGNKTLVTISYHT